MPMSAERSCAFAIRLSAVDWAVAVVIGSPEPRRRRVTASPHRARAPHARRRGAAGDADKVAQLGRERLDVRDLGDEDITLADRQTLPVRGVLGWAIHAFVVNAQLLARLHVVEHY